jgi:hypothetical protein
MSQLKSFLPSVLGEIVTGAADQTSRPAIGFFPHDASFCAAFGLLFDLYLWSCSRIDHRLGHQSDGYRRCSSMCSTCLTTSFDATANNSQLVCMISTVPASGCSPDDMACICGNAELERTTSECMLANCTMQESLDAARVQASFCDLSRESKRIPMFVWTASIYSGAFISVVLRIAGKLVTKRIAMDDYIVVLALLLCAVPAGCTLASRLTEVSPYMDCN